MFKNKVALICTIAFNYPNREDACSPKVTSLHRLQLLRESAGHRTCCSEGERKGHEVGLAQYLPGEPEENRCRRYRLIVQDTRVVFHEI